MTVIYGDTWPNPETATAFEGTTEVELVFEPDAECVACYFTTRYEDKDEDPCFRAPCAADTRTDGRCGAWVRK